MTSNLPPISPLAAAMASIPVFSALIQKGGSGKTTTNYTFAEYCAIIKQKRVLIIDLDPQCDMSKAYGFNETVGEKKVPVIHPDFDPEDEYHVKNYSARSDITEIFYGKEPIPYATYIQPGMKPDFVGMLDVIPASEERLHDILNLFPDQNGDANQKLKNGRDRYIDFAFRLSEFLATDGVQERYDLIVLDAGPTDNLLFRAAIFAASHIVCPYTADNYTLGGVATLMNVANHPKRRIRGFNALNFLGILPSIIPGTSKTAKAVIERNMEIFADTHLPGNIIMKQSDELCGRKIDVERSEGRPHSIFLDSRASSRKHYEQVCGYLYDKVFEGRA